MKFFAVLPALLAVAAGEADPYYTGYAGHAGLGYAGLGYQRLGYAGAYAAAPVAVAAVHSPVAAVRVASPVIATVNAAAPVAAISAETTSSQYRSQDEAGNTAFGYRNINNAHQQQGTAFGKGVTGSYSFRDQAGVHTVNYVADDFGYRVLSRSRRAIAYAATPAAASREAVLTTIQLNPGHATFYRVE